MTFNNDSNNKTTPDEKRGGRIKMSLKNMVRPSGDYPLKSRRDTQYPNDMVEERISKQCMYPKGVTTNGKQNFIICNILLLLFIVVSLDEAIN